MENLSIQAKNSIKLFKGGNPAKIKFLLSMQKPEVRNELMEYFNAHDLNELAIKLSEGKK